MSPLAPSGRATDPPPPGPAPLGARLEGGGATFGLLSGVAEAVDLCLFDEEGREERRALHQGEESTWAGHVAGVGAGQRYGFRVQGPWDPSGGSRCNPAKLLIDPYARAVRGEVVWDPAVYGHAAGDPDRPDPADSAPFVPRSVVADDRFDWGADRPPARPYTDTVIYELHVKGFTQGHPDVPPALRGTYAGLAHPAAVEHLVRLGVTAVELMPVHQHVHDAQLVVRGLRNYWGYQSLGFFAPHDEYAAARDGAGQVREFKEMVRALHAAGLEVILDVVYNHTAEGSEWGPTLCLRGVDNAAYYRLQDDRRRYVDDTGCGNTLDAHRMPALRLIMDSLRYWVQEVHVDGFRFDLAASLGRAAADFDPNAAFLDAVAQDPVLSRVKHIAEPWDVGAGGYDVGAFPSGWSEWNGRYRDSVRDFWRSREGALADFATRITGSSDLYGHGGRRPTASINLVTAHDGFCLADLVAYDAKHNEANGEGNRDGADDNRSWNCGVEGPTDDPGVLALRARQQRNLLATLLLSQGVPMILGGDELGRTQGGNNNAYCQDNPTSWVDWAAAGTHADLTAFTRRLCALRAAHPAFRRRQFLHGRPAAPSGRADLAWFRPDGRPMAGDDWSQPWARAVAAFLSGEGSEDEPADAPFLQCFNAWWEPVSFLIPDPVAELGWSVVLDTGDPEVGADAPAAHDPAAPVAVGPRSLVVLCAG